MEVTNGELCTAREVSSKKINKRSKFSALVCKRDVRIFTVKEYQALRAAIPKDRHRVILDLLIITGMRYVEMQRLYKRRDWYNPTRNHIHLDSTAQRKAKRKHLERTIHPLPGAFSYIMKDFFGDKMPPTEAAWNRLLQRHGEKAGFNPYGISAKSTRKSIESWLIAAGMLESTVCLRQGHSELTSMRHYQGLAFSDSEILDIKKQLAEWGLMK